MSNKKIPEMVLLAMLFVTGAVNATQDPIRHLNSYRQQGIDQTDEEKGRQLWNTSVSDRSCTNCHGESPVNPGKHVKTGKAIEPMAPSVNPSRYQNAKKVEKWFLRNCKWTYGRKCSLQEKADILTWLAGQ